MINSKLINVCLIIQNNCNFTDNHAEDYGGAVFFLENGNVTNCNFTVNNITLIIKFNSAVFKH